MQIKTENGYRRLDDYQPQGLRATTIGGYIRYLPADNAQAKRESWYGAFLMGVDTSGFNL